MAPIVEIQVGKRFNRCDNTWDPLSSSCCTNENNDLVCNESVTGFSSSGTPAEGLYVVTYGRRPPMGRKVEGKAGNSGDEGIDSNVAIGLCVGALVLSLGTVGASLLILRRIDSRVWNKEDTNLALITTHAKIGEAQVLSSEGKYAEAIKALDDLLTRTENTTPYMHKSLRPEGTALQLEILARLQTNTMALGDWNRAHHYAMRAAKLPNANVQGTLVAAEDAILAPTVEHILSGAAEFAGLPTAQQPAVVTATIKALRTSRPSQSFVLGGAALANVLAEPSVLAASGGVTITLPPSTEARENAIATVLRETFRPKPTAEQQLFLSVMATGAEARLQEFPWYNALTPENRREVLVTVLRTHANGNIGDEFIINAQPAPRITDEGLDFAFDEAKGLRERLQIPRLQTTPGAEAGAPLFQQPAGVSLDVRRLTYQQRIYLNAALDEELKGRAAWDAGEKESAVAHYREQRFYLDKLAGDLEKLYPTGKALAESTQMMAVPPARKMAQYYDQEFNYREAIAAYEHLATYASGDIEKTGAARAALRLDAEEGVYSRLAGKNFLSLEHTRHEAARSIVAELSKEGAPATQAPDYKQFVVSAADKIATDVSQEALREFGVHPSHETSDPAAGPVRNEFQNALLQERLGNFSEARAIYGRLAERTTLPGADSVIVHNSLAEKLTSTIALASLTGEDKIRFMNAMEVGREGDELWEKDRAQAANKYALQTSTLEDVHGAASKRPEERLLARTLADIMIPSLQRMADFHREKDSLDEAARCYLKIGDLTDDEAVREAVREIARDAAARLEIRTNIFDRLNRAQIGALPETRLDLARHMWEVKGDDALQVTERRIAEVEALFQNRFAEVHAELADPLGGNFPITSQIRLAIFEEQIGRPEAAASIYARLAANAPSWREYPLLRQTASLIDVQLARVRSLPALQTTLAAQAAFAAKRAVEERLAVEVGTGIAGTSGVAEVTGATEVKGTGRVEGAPEKDREGRVDEKTEGREREGRGPADVVGKVR